MKITGIQYIARIILLVMTQPLLQTVSAQFSVSSNQHYLLKDGKPFFWLGDTGWELFHRLTREDADQYLKRRSEQGFTVIQAVVLAEFDGLHTPNPYGNTPLLNDDPAKPNEKYFEHVDYIIDKAASYNLNIGVLPTWGDKVFKDKWGTGPEIFNEQNAALYGSWIANRYKNKTNIIWILGGDRYPRHEKDIAIWRAMALAIMKETNGKALISYHSQPNLLGSAEWFRNEKWFGFNLFQTGHCRETEVYDRIQTSYTAQPIKPVIDGEPIYEDHPVCFNARDLGTSSAYDVRKAAYLDLFAGAFGHTYGCHDIWQFYSRDREAVNGPHVYWQQAMELPGANQMTYVKKLIESHPFLERVPDQSLIKENNYNAAERIQATRGNDYLFVYTATGKPFTIVLEKIKGSKLQCYWFNPRDGKTTSTETIDNKGTRRFTPPSSGYGQDWVLVIDDASKQYLTNLAVISSPADTTKLVALLQSLAAKEKNPLLKRHFESVALMANDTTHGFSYTKNNIEAASGALNFFQHEGGKWETYADGPRPLMMAFTSPTDHKNSFYWLFLPKGFNPGNNDYSFYMELHGSGGGYNDNPRVMLLAPLQPQIAGVTHQGYRKEGLFILPWGRGDKSYREIAETDIFECLNDFDKQFKTDPRRQYLFGFSMGGAGTFHIAQKSMDRWTAIGMYSAAFRSVTQEEADKFKNKPVWMAWGETESWAVNDRLLKDFLLKAGVNVKWAEVKGVGHNYLGEYQEELMNWFLLHIKK